MRAAFLLTLMIAALPALALDPGALHLNAGSFDRDALSRLAPPEIDDGLWVLHFPASIGSAQRERVSAAGVEILGYLPENALLVRIGDTGLPAESLGADFSHPYRPEWRRDPGLTQRGGEIMDLCLDLLPGEDAQRVSDRVVGQGAQVVQVIQTEGMSRVILRASSSQVESLSRIPGIRWMGEVTEATDRLEFVRWIVQSAIVDSLPIWDAGLNGEGQILGHLDSGIQVANCYFYDPDGNPVGPNHRKVVYVQPGLGYSSHGLHTASIMAGDIEPVYGWDTHRGLAYKARFATSHRSSITHYADLQLHHEHGARIHTNSWGQDNYTHYTLLCQDIDRYSWDYEEDLVAFAVTNQSTLRTPENAKNVLAVGATRNGEDEFENHGYGGEGPTYDGRRKPEIYAPGRTVRAADRATTSDPNEWDGGFCNGTSKGGTSMACPTVAAAGAIIRQYFMEGWYPGGAPSEDHSFTPTGALLRAALLNSTIDLAGVDGYPSDKEGWGRLQMNLGLRLGEDAPLSLYLEDFRRAEGVDTGQERAFYFAVSDDSLDLKVTLAFSDYPAEVLATSAPVNDLDLVLTSPSGLSFLGNWFSGGYSLPGGDADAINSVERIVVVDPEPGTWVLKVIGTNVPMGPQGFGFVVSGQLTEADIIPPTLALDLRVEEDVLHLFLSSSEELDAETVEMSLQAETGGTTLQVNPVPGGEGALWAASYQHGLGTESFGIQICGNDISGNQSCLFDEVSLHALDSGQSALLQSSDGKLTLDIAPGNLDCPPMIAIHPIEQTPYLDIYHLFPATVFQTPSILEWDFSAVDFPAWGDPENLKLRDEDGEVLDSYFDAERQKLVCSVDELGTFFIGWGFDGSSDEVNASFAFLGKAFPNPYRPLSHGDIRFALELRDAQRLKAEVFEVSGRRVDILHEGWMFPGHRELIWDGRGSEDEDLASGIYFLRLEAAGQVITRKIVMMR
jgi:subtilisin family serine protease